MSDKIIPATRIRKITAQRMQESWNTSPAFLTYASVDVTEIKAFRKVLLERYGRKISFNTIYIKAVAKALAEFPYINASYNDDNIILHGDINIGLAVSVEEGLIVPNVKNCGKKSFLEIEDDLDRLITSARNNKLEYDDMVGGTFTIASMSIVDDVLLTIPVINQPELAILGVYRAKDTPVVVDGEIVIRPMMNLSFVADHRVIDGAMAGFFIKRLKELLSNPETI